MAETVDRTADGDDPSPQLEKPKSIADDANHCSTDEKANGPVEGTPDLNADKTDRINEKSPDMATPKEELPEEPATNDVSRTADPQGENGSRAVNKDDDDDDPFAGLDDVSSMDIFELSNYTFGKKNSESKSRAMQQLPKVQLAEVLRKNYEQRGMRRSVGAVILVHSHNFPHVLLLQRSDGKGEYALPGGRLRPGESDEEGLQRKLGAKLKPSVEGDPEEDQELDIGEKICNWYAIDFNRRYYPYVPAHITKPKEELHVYTVMLPNKFTFSVPKNLQLVAVPMFELYNNASTYGDVICAIPALLSRWHINYC